jgi:hypothetical protein
VLNDFSADGIIFTPPPFPELNPFPTSRKTLGSAPEPELSSERRTAENIFVLRFHHNKKCIKLGMIPFNVNKFTTLIIPFVFLFQGFGLTVTQIDINFSIYYYLRHKVFKCKFSVFIGTHHTFNAVRRKS